MKAIPGWGVGQRDSIVLGFKAVTEPVEYDQQADVGHGD